MTKKVRTLCAAVLAAVVLTAAAVSMNSGIDASEAEQQEIEHVVKDGATTMTLVSDVIDETGKFDETCLDTYTAKLQDTFTADSGYISKYAGIMQQICGIFDKTTDVCLDSAVVKFNTESLKVEGDRANMVCDMTTLSKSVKYNETAENKAYCAVFAVGTKTITCELERDDAGMWRISNWEMKNYRFGSPVDMGLATESLEKDFSTREEACAYAASLTVADICPLVR